MDYNPIDPTPVNQYSETPITEQQQPEGAATAEPASEPAPAEPAPQFDFDSLIKEKTGGRFEKWDDLNGFVQEPVKFENEASKKVFDYIKEGKVEDLVNFYAQQQFLANTDKLSKEEMVLAHMRLQDPEASDEELKADFELTFGEKPDAGSMEEDVYKKELLKYEVKLKKATKAANEYFNTLKQEVKLPDLPQKEIKFSAGDLSKETEAYNAQINKSVESALNDFSKLSINIEDKQQGVAFPVEFTITDEDKGSILSSSKDFTNYLESVYGQGDQFDGRRLAEDMWLIRNKEAILKSAVLRGFNEGKLAQINGQANAKITPVTTSLNVKTDDTAEQGFKNFVLS